MDYFHLKTIKQGQYRLDLYHANIDSTLQSIFFSKMALRIITNAFKKVNVKETILQKFEPNHSSFFPATCTFHSTVRTSNAYEGSGKTTVTMLNEECGQHLLVDSFDEKGFRLSNRAYAFGAILLFPNVCYSVRKLFGCSF